MSEQSQLDRLYRRTTMMVAPVKIVATNDEGPVHRAQIEINGTPEVLDDVAVVEIYGVASHAPVNSDATAFFVQGNRSNAVVIGTNNQKFRLRGLKSGEVALYTDEGDEIRMARGKIVEIKAGEQVKITCKSALVIAEDKMRVESPRLECTGDIEANVP
jgi:phage gp45-like